MAGLSDIEWTDATWNPVSGCSIVSPGCTNCYAMRMAARLQAMGHSKYVGTTRKSGRRQVWTGVIHLDEAALAVPWAWKKPRRVFVNSMSDLFHEDVPEAFIGKVWDVMGETNWHTYQILTKRPDRMAAVLSGRRFRVLPNVWIGTSIENATYKWRIAKLSAIPAAVRFISFEPLLGPLGTLKLDGIHWAIVGGESGPHARPMRREWVEEIKRSCRSQGVAFFFKQWGGVRKKETGRELDGRTWDEFPTAHGCVTDGLAP
ncbi:MAG: phage Gp37/Gp68 family protein [Alphaproteobacteria bacterium]